MKVQGPQTYVYWNAARLRGRGGKKKIRRDTTLAIRPDGVLTFSYGDELIATLDDMDTYTFYKGEQAYYPTHSNIYRIVGQIAVYRDTAHHKHYRQPIRISTRVGRWINEDGKWTRAKTMPFTNGIQYRNGTCLNPEIAVDYKRTLNRTLSLPWLRKTEVLAKVLRVATRMGVLVRDTTKRWDAGFEAINIDDPTALDAEIVLRMGNAIGLRGWQSQDPEKLHAALLRCAENGLADYREWLYLKHGCYEMLPVVHSNKPEGEGQ